MKIVVITWFLFLFIQVVFGRPAKVENTCAFTWSTDSNVEDDLSVAAISNAIKSTINTTENVMFKAADSQFAAIFAGDDSESSAQHFCNSLPTSIENYLAEFMPELDKITITDAVLGAAPGVSPRGCYIYGYNLSQCGYGSPMFGCSERRECYKYKRGQCSAYRRVCYCGGSFFGGC